MITPAALPPDVLTALRRHAAASYPDECCGVVFTRGPAFEFMACRNVAPAPSHTFHVGVGDMLKIARKIRDDGATIAVIYHSHVDTPATFSARDKRFARAWPTTLHLVFAVTNRGVIAQHAYTAAGVQLDEPVMEPA